MSLAFGAVVSAQRTPKAQDWDAPTVVRVCVCVCKQAVPKGGQAAWATHPLRSMVRGRPHFLVHGQSMLLKCGFDF